MLFPILAIELHDRHRWQWLIETAHIDVNAIRIGARCIERFHATRATEGMFGYASIKGISGQVVLAAQQRELAER